MSSFCIFQACRGNKVDDGVLVADAAEYVTHADVFPEYDFLIYFAAVSGGHALLHGTTVQRVLHILINTHFVLFLKIVFRRYSH